MNDSLRTRMKALVQERVLPLVSVAGNTTESDLTEFWALKNHYKTRQELTKGLFTEASRPDAVKRLYEQAREADDSLCGTRNERIISVSPVLGKRKNKLPLDIETRKPAALRKLRRWTSTEALGRVTVEPDSSLRLEPTPDTTDHTLPSPEEQLQAIALKFPAEMVTVDVTGKNFERMSHLRRSMMNSEYDDTVRRRTKAKKPRGKRRNTIAGTDTKELAAIVGESSDTNMGKSTPEGATLGPEKKSHLENLKEWGRSRLRQIRNMESGVRLRSVSSSRRKWDKDEPNPHSSSGNWSASSESGHSTATSHVPRSSASSGSGCTKNKKGPIISTSSSVTSESTLTPDEGETSSMYSCDTEGYYTSFHLDSGLKTLREEEPCTPLHSTSALSVNSQSNNQSAESEYELFGKGSTSTTASSAGTVCTTLLVPPAPTVPERVCSQLSGIKTLPERTTRSHDPEKRETQSLKLAKHVDMKMLSFDEIKRISESNSDLNKQNDMDHDQMENKNCIITVDVHHERNTTPEKCGDSPDSGHNTCSSPVDSVASPSLDLEMSECSDLEGVDRMERIRVKTTINSSRIPSMCVITPPQSDDEVSLTHSYKPVDSGEYVTIADIRGPSSPKAVAPSPVLKPDTEFVSLNDLPKSEGLSEPKRQGARVTLNAEGKVVYSSDSLRRRKTVHTTGTFEPGPCVVRNENSPVPQRQVNIRPINIQSPLFANRKVITPTPVQKNQPKTVTKNEKETFNSSTRQPLSSVNRTLSPQSQRKDSISNQKQYFTKADIDKTPTTPTSRPLSPLVSPTNQRNFMRNSSPVTLSNRATSPKMIVKAKAGTRPLSPTQSRGAYVRVNQPSPPDDNKLIVKRSDSYRIANEETVFNPNSLGRKQYGPGVIAGPSLISAIQAARNNKAPEEAKSNDFSRSFNDSSESSGQLTWPRSTSTPTKANESPPLNFSTTSPISKNVTPTKNSRSAMDLYAIIHESKKRIQSLQKPLSQPINWPKAIPAKSVAPVPVPLDNNIPKPMPPLTNINQQRYVKQANIGYGSLPRLQVQTLEESPRNLQRKAYSRQPHEPFSRSSHNPERSSLASDRHGPQQPTSRNDFKKLLLQAAWGTNPTRGSAVERLKNKGLQQSIKPLSHDVLSSTILEDCDDEDEQAEQEQENHKLASSSLVNDQDKKFKTKLSKLETAL
ncbi:serine-rich adhesin for platelets [Halyomorpha halys]|uniref:serine-rich adhesin for platelets n=1 Tax=Halyomorpha halys TaxID=286706 RepID=UPI0034D1DCB4